jgi:hypothetical protein
MYFSHPFFTAKLEKSKLRRSKMMTNFEFFETVFGITFRPFFFSSKGKASCAN